MPQCMHIHYTVYTALSINQTPPPSPPPTFLYSHKYYIFHSPPCLFVYAPLLCTTCPFINLFMLSTPISCNKNPNYTKHLLSAQKNCSGNYNVKKDGIHITQTQHAHTHTFILIDIHTYTQLYL